MPYSLLLEHLLLSSFVVVRPVLFIVGVKTFHLVLVK